MPVGVPLSSHIRAVQTWLSGLEQTAMRDPIKALQIQLLCATSD